MKRLQRDMVSIAAQIILALIVETSGAGNGLVMQKHPAESVRSHFAFVGRTQLTNRPIVILCQASLPFPATFSTAFSMLTDLDILPKSLNLFLAKWVHL